MVWSYNSAPDLSEQQFSEWSKLLEDRVGIRLASHQKQFLRSQVAIRMREVGTDDFSSYFRLVTESENGQLEWSILLDRLVVKETSFFRHQPSINFVCHQLQDKINNNALDDSFQIWSLGCATGEEAYSLAMLVNESFELAKREALFGVTATDVSRVAISLARTGRYSKRKLEFVPPSLRYKYFSNCEKDQFEFIHEVSDKICFTCANALNTDAMPNLQFDVIYCQNLLVYFSQQRRHTLLDAIVKKMKPGGILVIGLGEVINWTNSDVERVARADVQAYLKPADRDRR